MVGTGHLHRRRAQGVAAELVARGGVHRVPPRGAGGPAFGDDVAVDRVLGRRTLRPAPVHVQRERDAHVESRGSARRRALDGKRGGHPAGHAGAADHRPLRASLGVAQGARREGRRGVARDGDGARRALREQARARGSVREDPDHRGGGQDRAHPVQRRAQGPGAPRHALGRAGGRQDGGLQRVVPDVPGDAQPVPVDSAVRRVRHRGGELHGDALRARGAAPRARHPARAARAGEAEEPPAPRGGGPQSAARGAGEDAPGDARHVHREHPRERGADPESGRDQGEGDHREGVAGRVHDASEVSGRATRGVSSHRRAGLEDVLPDPRFTRAEPHVPVQSELVHRVVQKRAR
mmetsp:Transcript_8281/g.35120  ORF Transcript_8281/g.35120 Transcript_8281/m.35120 type:complete len:351 (+) Transcript_8281:6656-7708(+)